MSFRTALAIGAVVLASLQAIPSHALLFRAYLSSTGNDANPCVVQQPCRLLPAALAAIQDGGEVWILDSANYNTMPVNIAKSVTILAIPGALGSVVGTTSGSAIIINTPGVAVSLRNLVISRFPGAGADIGVEMSAGAKLTIEGSVIAGFMGPGVRVYTNAKVNITGTIFRDNVVGYFGASGALASISDSKFFNNGYRAVMANTQTAGTTTTVLLSDSIISNCDMGASADTIGVNGTVRITITRSSISNCTVGVGAFGTVGAASVTLASSTLSGLDTSTWQDGAVATVETLGNNTLRHAGSSFGVITPVSQF